jgi:hypothetical protein
MTEVVARAGAEWFVLDVTTLSSEEGFSTSASRGMAQPAAPEPIKRLPGPVKQPMYPEIEAELGDGALTVAELAERLNRPVDYAIVAVGQLRWMGRLVVNGSGPSAVVRRRR